MNYITSKADVMGGLACIRGTRIPLARILFLLKDGHTLDSIHELYPWVKFDVLEGAIDELIAKMEVPHETTAI